MRDFVKYFTEVLVDLGTLIEKENTGGSLIIFLFFSLLLSIQIKNNKIRVRV